MVVYFLTKQPELCNLICDELKKSFHVCRVFIDPDEYYATVKVLGSTKVDLLAIDYRMFDHDMFDPYAVLRYEKIIIPLIYYNDPYPEPEQMASFWKVKNKTKLENEIDDSILAKYTDLFLLIQNIMQSEQVNPFVSTICRPLLYEPKEECEFEVIPVEEFAKKYHITKSRYRLLEYLYQNRNVILSTEEICQSLWNEYSERTKQILYSYIHDLRKVIDSCENPPYFIKRNGIAAYIFKINYPESMKNNPENKEYKRIKFKLVSVPK